MTTPFVSLRSRSTWYFALIFAIYLVTGCDGFWVPCSEEGVICSMQNGTEDGGKTDQATDPNSPIGPTRKFEWWAKVQLDPTQLKYVGLMGTTPLFLATDNTKALYWKAYGVDWGSPMLPEVSRIHVAALPIGLPALPPGSPAPLMNFGEDQLVTSGTQIYWLRGHDKTLRWPTKDAKDVFENLRLPGTTSFPLFRHPRENGLMIAAQPSDAKFADAVLIRWDEQSSNLMESSQPASTALVMGDLDGTEVATSSKEAIFFAGGRVEQLLHQGLLGFGPIADIGLKDGLQAALDRNDKDSTILAGFVADLNNDKLADFVYARGQNVYFTSYKGRKGWSVGQFEDWPKDTFPPLLGETVRSLVAVDMTGDGYPELVIETDKFVRFYRNNLKTQ